MRSASAGRVSRGGRRKSTEPPGNDIMRKKASCSALPASMFRIHKGNSPTAEIAHPTATANVSTASRRVRLRGKSLRGKSLHDESRKHFNLHLLRSNVVRNILGRNGQLVRAGNRLL